MIARLVDALPGDTLPPLAVEIDRSALIRYAGAADDYVRQHWDHSFMIGQGYPDVVVHGWLTTAHMLRALTGWVPPAVATLARYAVRYRRPIFPGTLHCGGTVTRSAAGEAEVALWARNADGATLATGTALLTGASGTR
jgi:acyl dehydratase